MRHEKERCLAALKHAQEGATVSLISSGDAGIYGMAGLALEMASAEGINVPIEIVPGVSAALTAAARMGAPLSLDHACISLSDILVPWKTILTRLKAVAAADIVTVLFNPRSSKRISQFEEALSIFRRYRRGSTPVGLGKCLGSTDEVIIITDLDNIDEQDVDMRTVVIIGNSTSRIINNWFVTPRGYLL